MPKQEPLNIYDNTIDSVATGLKSYLYVLRKAENVKTGLTKYDMNTRDYYWDIVIENGEKCYTFRLTLDYLRHHSFSVILLDIVSAYEKESGR